MTSTTVKPPALPDIVSPGTPANEWASSTNSMLGSTQQAHSPDSNATTPGLDIPGSYPKDLDEHFTSSNTSTSGPHILKNKSESPKGAEYVQSARQYIPDQVERGLETAGETAAAYLPIPQGVKDTVSAYWRHSQTGESEIRDKGTSYPSTEHEGAKPSDRVSAGVGALPGSVNESRVAILPDERITSDNSQPQISVDSISLPSTEHEGAKPSERLSAGVGALPGSINERNVAVLPEERAVNDGPKIPIGVGDLPGSKDEIGIALLPEEKAHERIQKETKETLKDTKLLGPSGSGSAEKTSEGLAIADVGEAPKDIMVTPDRLLSDPKPGKPQTVTDIPSQTKQDADYHPAKLRPPPSGTGADEKKNTAESTGADEDGPSSTAIGSREKKSEDLVRSESKTSSEDSQHRKSGFMAKVKGEMKIISGKISGHIGKVEEGKKIKMGEV